MSGVLRKGRKMSILERRKAKASTMLLAAPIAALAVSGFSGSSAHGAAIGSSDLLFFQAGTGNGANGTVADSLAGTPFLIDDLSTSNNTLVQQFNITNLTGNNNASNSTTLYICNNGSNGQLALSDNGTLVTFAGYQGFNAGDTNTTNELNQVTRQAGAIDANGNFTLGASYNSSGNGQVRSAYTPDGTNYLFADKSGIFTNGASNTATNSTGLRYLAAFGGTTVGVTQGNATVMPFYTYNSGNSTLTGITGNNGTGSGYTNFVMLQSGNNGSAYDTIYVPNSTSIVKYDYTGGVLTYEGTDTLTAAANTTGKIAAITGVEVGNNTVDLFFTTTANTADPNGTVEEIVDNTGWNNSINSISGGTPSVLYTAPAGVDLFGITTAPVPEPASASLLALAALGMLGRRRRTKPTAT